MKVHLTCEHCGKKLSAPAERAGKRGRCPTCYQIIVVPPVDAITPTRTRSASKEGPPPPAAAPSYHPGPLLPQRPEGPDHELIDMTAMVDIVFFLLIFFMVTSMHSVQSSISLPTPEARAELGTRRASQANEGDHVLVQIDADDTIAVDGDEVPTRQELIARLKAAEKDSLLVLASGEARHGTVVMALDAGSDARMEQIRLVTEGLETE